MHSKKKWLLISGSLLVLQFVASCSYLNSQNGSQTASGRHAPALNPGGSQDVMRVPVENADIADTTSPTTMAAPVVPVTIAANEAPQPAGNASYPALTTVPPAPQMPPKEDIKADYNTLNTQQKASESDRSALMNNQSATVMTSPQNGQVVNNPANAMPNPAAPAPVYPSAAVSTGAMATPPASPNDATASGTANGNGSGFNSWLHNLFTSTTGIFSPKKPDTSNSTAPSSSVTPLQPSMGAAGPANAMTPAENPAPSYAEAPAASFQPATPGGAPVLHDPVGAAWPVSPATGATATNAGRRVPVENEAIETGSVMVSPPPMIMPSSPTAPPEEPAISMTNAPVLRPPAAVMMPPAAKPAAPPPVAQASPPAPAEAPPTMPAAPAISMTDTPVLKVPASAVVPSATEPVAPAPVAQASPPPPAQVAPAAPPEPVITEAAPPPVRIMPPAPLAAPTALGPDFVNNNPPPQPQAPVPAAPIQPTYEAAPVLHDPTGGPKATNAASIAMPPASVASTVLPPAATPDVTHTLPDTSQLSRQEMEPVNLVQPSGTSLGNGYLEDSRYPVTHDD